MSVVLIGYRGSGKTTIGRRLADRLWQDFVDTDERIVERAGKPIKAIFETDGEEFFRSLEAAVLGEVLALEERVIALGGGAVVREANRKLLLGCRHSIIYLRCEAESLLKRIESDPNSISSRPDLTPLGGGIDEIRKVLAEREPLYRQVMKAELDVTNLTPEEAVVRVARMV
jgi:shikimate kinase